MSQSGIRAKLCAGKISIDSSIQAQHSGDFMRRKWRSYGLFDSSLFASIAKPWPDRSERYQDLLKQEGMIVSMSRTADCYENAAMESFFHSLKGECLDSQSFQTRVQARSVTFEYIEAFYNCRILRHSILQYLNPLRYEQLMCEPSSSGAPQIRVMITKEGNV